MRNDDSRTGGWATTPRGESPGDARTTRPAGGSPRGTRATASGSAPRCGRGAAARFYQNGGGKRAADLVGAALLLALLAPVLAAAALAVRLTLGRPVLFRQLRAGRGGAPFVLLKLRSMRAPRLPGESDAARLTPLGRRLRATAIDEIPQLVNVLRGEMSLVGPRPLPPDYTPLYTPRQALRLALRPGIAGLAQAAGRNAVPWEVRLELDARYAAGPITAGGDARLLLACLRLLLRAEGVSAPGHATMPRFRGGAGSDRG